MGTYQGIAERVGSLIGARVSAVLAAARQLALNGRSQAIEQRQGHLAQCRQEIARLAESRAKLGAQIEIVQAKRLQVAALLAQKESAERRRRALEVVGGTPDARRVDRLVERIQQAAESAEGQVEALAASADSRTAELMAAEGVERLLAH